MINCISNNRHCRIEIKDKAMNKTVNANKVCKTSEKIVCCVKFQAINYCVVVIHER